MRVLVIPEDSRRDKDLLKPLVEAMMAAVGHPRAKVRICEDPVLRGVDEALKLERIAVILDLYKMVDLFLVIVDRDGQAQRRERLKALEQGAAELLGAEQVLLGEHAWQEVEVWILAGHELPADWSWPEIRTEIHPKERYFLPFLKACGFTDDAAGRSLLAHQASANFRRIHSICPEDVGVLTTRLRELRGPTP